MGNDKSWIAMREREQSRYATAMLTIVAIIIILPIVGIIISINL